MDQPAASVQTVDTLTDSADFRWYLTTHGSWFAALGLQMVIFPYLVTEVLLGSPKMIGIAQMSLMAPTWVLMLFAGAIADRRDGRKLLIALNAAAIVPPLVLSVVVGSGTLTYALIIVYALSMGVLSAFSMPTRDSLLNDVIARIHERKGDAHSKLQRAVTLSNMLQFGGQTLGMIIAGAAAIFGAAPLIFFHAIIAALGTFAAHRLHAPVRKKPANEMTAHPLKAVREGLSEVYRSPVLLPLVLTALSVGLFFAGSFMVTLPVLIREEYGGGISRFSAATVSFWIGTIVSSITLIQMGHIANRGRALLLALASGVVMLTAMSIPMPFAALCLVFFLWGLGAGVALTLSRGIVQESAPATHRARILAIYQLGFSGGMPLGSLAMGFLIEAFGVRASVYVPAVAMAIVLTVMAFRSKLLSIDKVTQRLAAEAAISTTGDSSNRTEDAPAPR